MKTFLVYLAPVVLLILTPSVSLAIAPIEIVKNADRARAPQKSYSCLVTVANAGDSEKSTYHVSVNDAETSLVEQVAPQRLTGRKLLMTDSNLWIFTPNIHRPMRVSLQQRLTGEVANGDLARTNFANDYTATLASEGTMRKRKVYKLDLVAKTKDVTYRKIEYFVEKKTFFPVEAKFFAISGKLLKVARYGRFQNVLGAKRATEMIIEDAVQKSKKSVLLYSQFKREKFNASLFNKESLAR